MSKPPVDPLGPITIEQSKASAAVRGTFGIIAGLILMVVAVFGLVEMMTPNQVGMGVHALYAGGIGVVAFGYGLGQIKFSKQDNRIHFHADQQGISGLLLPDSEVIPWTSVARIEGSINDVHIELTDGEVIHIREGLVGKTKGLKGLPSSIKIADRLKSLQSDATGTRVE